MAPATDFRFGLADSESDSAATTPVSATLQKRSMAAAAAEIYSFASACRRASCLVLGWKAVLAPTASEYMCLLVELPTARRVPRRRPTRPRGSSRCRALSTTGLCTGLVIGGYTRDGDAEAGSWCTSGTVLATVTGELELHVASGPTGLGRRGESARSGESGDRLHRRVVADPREMEGLC